MTRYYTYVERRGIRQVTRAELEERLFGNILPRGERRGYAAVACLLIGSIVVFYAMAYAVCRARGWM